MTDQQNFYPVPAVQAWLDQQPQRGKTKAINAALLEHIQRRDEQKTLLGLMHNVVDSIDDLTEVIAGLAATVIMNRGGERDD